MHELSIALGLVEAVCDELPRLGATRVHAVRLRVGALSGVATDALRFSFDVAAAGTPLEGARLHIEDVPVSAFCAACGTAGVLRDPASLYCPSCGAPADAVAGGRELELVALEVIDDDADR